MGVEGSRARPSRWVRDRRRELVMTARGKMGLWLKLLAPETVDAIARRAIDRGR